MLTIHEHCVFSETLRKGLSRTELSCWKHLPAIQTQWSAHLQWQSREWPCGSVHLEGSRSFDGLDSDGPWSKCFLLASASHRSDRSFDWRLDIRNYLPASQVPWLTDPASEWEMKKHSTSMQCSDFLLRNLYPKLEMYWEQEVFNHCEYLRYYYKIISNLSYIMKQEYPTSWRNNTKQIYKKLNWNRCWMNLIP